MADMKMLKKFQIEATDKGFNLHIEDQAGAILELTATREQVDLIADDLDELLSETEEDDEIEDEDENGEPAKAERN